MMARWLGIILMFGFMSLGAHGEEMPLSEDFAFAPAESLQESSEMDESLVAASEAPPLARAAALTVFGGIGNFPESNSLTNRWTFGIFIENLLADGFYVELEGSLAENRYRTGFGNYTSEQYNGGIAAKWVPRVGPVAFEVGVGSLFSYYDGLVIEDLFQRDRWTVSARGTAGLSWYVTSSLLLGVKGDVLLPFAAENRISAYSPAALAIRNTSLRILGALTWEL